MARIPSTPTLDELVARQATVDRARLGMRNLASWSGPVHSRPTADEPTSRGLPAARGTGDSESALSASDSEMDLGEKWEDPSYTGNPDSDRSSGFSRSLSTGWAPAGSEGDGTVRYKDGWRFGRAR